jgi:hypothetical protein
MEMNGHTTVRGLLSLTAGDGAVQLAGVGAGDATLWFFNYKLNIRQCTFCDNSVYIDVPGFCYSSWTKH